MSLDPNFAKLMQFPFKVVPELIQKLMVITSNISKNLKFVAMRGVW